MSITTRRPFTSCATRTSNKSSAPYPPPAPDDEARKEIAALREALHALQEQKRTTPPLPSPEPPTHPPSNGKTEMGYKRAAILDTDEDSSHRGILGV